MAPPIIVTPIQPERPEQAARRIIDDNLRVAGWQVQSADNIDVSASLGVAVTELPMARGLADYALYVDRKTVGVVEAKAHGALSGAEQQTMRYAIPAPGTERGVADSPPRFLFESNGHKTYFTDLQDPRPRSREVFNFPRPETLKEWSEHPDGPLRQRLQRNLPPLAEARLWGAQARAIKSLEASFARGDARALIQMATGSGKTFTAVNLAYRLLKHAGAKRILFLVDRNNLGRQTFDEFANYTPPDADGRKFPALYNVQRLADNTINPASKVVVTTIQRLFSMLKGEADYDAGNEDDSAFENPTWQGEPPTVAYNAQIPPEFFDFVIIDECHRSIYDLWSQVLLYFDAFLIGLTATPAGKTLGFFNQNLAMQYGHDEAVLDGVNVDFDVYRIKTRITEEGATIESGEDPAYVAKRDKLTRQERLELLQDDLTYTANQVDRDIVAESQIRTVLQEFRQRLLPVAFPGREEVPKTLIFAKDDSHAEDIVRLTREVFAEGNDFCQKITYRTGFTKVTTTVKQDDGTESETVEWKRTSEPRPLS